MKSWSVKRKRMVIGFLMMFSFINIAYTINFITTLAIALEVNIFDATIALHYCWLSSVFYILLSYHVLTKVYPYEATKDDRLGESEVQPVQKS